MPERRVLFVYDGQEELTAKAVQVFRKIALDSGYTVRGVNGGKDSKFELHYAGLNAPNGSKMEPYLLKIYNEFIVMDKKTEDTLVDKFKISRDNIANLFISGAESLEAVLSPFVDKSVQQYYGLEKNRQSA